MQGGLLLVLLATLGIGFARNVSVGSLPFGSWVEHTERRLLLALRATRFSLDTVGCGVNQKSNHDILPFDAGLAQESNRRLHCYLGFYHKFSKDTVCLGSRKAWTPANVFVQKHRGNEKKGLEKS